MNLDEILLTTFYLDMDSNQCGYPWCCPGNQPKFIEVNFFPTTMHGLEMEDDLRQFMDDTEIIFKETGMPMFPCMLHHFCLPFSPVCALMYFMNQRKTRLEDLVRDFNKEKALPKGLYVTWNSDYYAMSQTNGRRGAVIPILKPGLEIKMNFFKRQEYCAKHGLSMPEMQQLNPNMAAPPPYNPNDQGFYPPSAPGFPQPNAPAYPPPPQQGGFFPPPPQQEQPRHYIIDTHHRHDSFHSNSS